MRLRHRLFLVTALVSLLPLIFFGVILVAQSYQNVEDVVTESLKVTAEYQIESIEAFCEQVKSEMELLSEYSFVKEELLVSLGKAEARPDSNNQVYIQSLLKERKAHHPYLHSISIVNVEFENVSASETIATDEKSELSTVKKDRLDGGFNIGDAYTRQTETGLKRLVTAYIGVFHEGELVGYIIEEIPTSFFEQFHANKVFWDHGVMQILDGYGEIITVGGNKEKTDQFYRDQSKHDTWVKSMQRRKGFEEAGALNYKIDQKTYVTSYAELQYSNWQIRVTVDVDAYSHHGFSYAALAVTILLIGTMLLAVVNYFISDRIITPIDHIKQVLIQVQQQEDYSIRIGVHTDDEVGELQCEINRLLECVHEARCDEQKEQAILLRKTEKDSMTGIYNKRAIGELVENMAREQAEHQGKIAVGFVDIDDFKVYNTKYGHAEGDHVIKFVAKTISEEIPGAVGRYGGDEFVFCMPAEDIDTVERSVLRLTRRLDDGVINGVTGERMEIPCSIGVVLEMAVPMEGHQLVHEADEAMYLAKEKGKHTYYIQNKTM